jgi:hypothetical protein
MLKNDEKEVCTMMTVTQRQEINASVSGPLRRLSGRNLSSALSIFTGIVHLVLAGPHFDESTWLGTAFLLDGVALMGAGIWLLLSGTQWAIRAVGISAALTALTYVASRTIGLPRMAPEAWDLLGLVTTGAEVAIVISWPFLNRFGRETAVRSGLRSRGRRDA